MDMTVEVPELPELTFDEASHIYRLNGDIIPSVSKLMEPLKDQCYGGNGLMWNPDDYDETE